MRRLILSYALLFLLGFSLVPPTFAQTPDLDNLEEASPSDEATESAEATASATPSATPRRVIESSSNITETRGLAQGKLEEFVLEQNTGPAGPLNFIQWAIRSAVMEGVPANTIVLVLMFPMITALIAASRHLIGLRGFGIFTPAIVAVGFLATGLTAGFILFFTIIAVATASRVIIRRLKLPYMPRTSLLLWVVSVTVLTILLISPFINLSNLANLSIFPILLMVLLAETFMEVQSKRSRSEAVEMTLETLLLAVVSYFIMNLELVQQLAISNPELVLFSVLIFNIFIGKFDGLRLMEYWRFRKIVN